MNSQTARQRILARLVASGTEQIAVPDLQLPQPPSFGAEEKITRLAAMMEAVQTEVHIVAAGRWTETLKKIARDNGWKRLLYGPGSPIGPAIETAWDDDDDGMLPQLMAYDGPVETFKEDLFQVDAGITSVRGGVADTGALVLWPDEHEPRLMSLVPPVHVAVLDADTIAGSLTEMIGAEHWVDGMPTNALLISGPSKTADIEFTLVFGVHGPKELILLIRK
jgi:L-lactate dehydrogenase complex protein LldG